MKVCSNCHQKKSLTEFHRRKASPDGYQNQCKYCQAAYRKSKRGEYDRAYYVRNREAKKRAQVEQKRSRIRRLKLERGGKCERCGYDRSLWSLTFHHRDPVQKKFAIGSVSRSLENLRMEAEKCDLLCLNCHGELHDEQYTRRSHH